MTRFKAYISICYSGLYYSPDAHDFDKLVYTEQYGIPFTIYAAVSLLSLTNTRLIHRGEVWYATGESCPKGTYKAGGTYKARDLPLTIYEYYESDYDHYCNGERTTGGILR